MSPERLNKALAAAGVASRRDCDELIAAGRVSINGRIVRELGSRVDLDTDEVLVDGQPLQRVDERVYMLLHKPVGVVSTADDPQGRPTVVQMVPDTVRVFPVGRLDFNSEGLILLTNDGELAHILTHPSFEVEKEYRVLLDAAPDSDTLREWRQGVMLDGERTAPAWVDVQEHTEQGVWVRVVLREGRKRQIREVAKLLGYDVLRLIRVREGSLLLGDLPSGEWRTLDDEEIAALKAHTLPPEPRDRNRMASERDRRSDSSDGFAADDSRPPRSTGTSDSRPPRRPSDERGYRGEGQSDSRPPRRPSDERGYRGEGQSDSRPPRRPDSSGERPPRSTGTSDSRPPRRPSDERGYRGESQSDSRPSRPRPPSSRGDPRYRGESQSDSRPSRPRPPSSRGDPRYRGESQSDSRPSRPRPPSSRGEPRYRGDEYPPRSRPDDSRSERPPRDGDEQPRRPRSGGGSTGNSSQPPRRDAGGREQQGSERREGSRSSNRSSRSFGGGQQRPGKPPFRGKPGMKPTRRPSSKPAGSQNDKPTSRRERRPNEDSE